MAISQTRYILITSGAGGKSAAGRKELIARLMTTNHLAPTKGILEFGGGSSTALKNVGAYFGSTSDEYKFASKYFGYVAKDARTPAKISFARYSKEATAAQLISTEAVPALSAFTSIEDGSFKLKIDDTEASVTGLDFSEATSLADVASAIETKLQTTFDGSAFEFSNGHFCFTAADAGVAKIYPMTDGASGTSIKGLLRLGSSNNPVVSDGVAAETLTESLDRIANTSNNFGTFDFVESLTNAEVEEIGKWTAAQNVNFQFHHAVTAENYSDVQAGVNGLDGVGLTLGDATASFMPMAIAAAIDYNRPGASTNFMFTQFNSETPTVTSDVDADKYDKKKINYLGATQQAGKDIAFYQRGFLQGDIADMGVFLNEQWLKDAILTEFLNLLLALKQVTANEDGAALAKGIIVSIVENEAKQNGVIQSGKTLNNVQKAYITSVTGDYSAWRDVQTNGYWLDVNVQELQNDNNGLTEYKIDYLLVYGKGDSIRKVTGTNILI